MKNKTKRRFTYTARGLEARRRSIAQTQPWKSSPSGKKAGQRLTLICALDTCQNTFNVVPSQANRRKYCSKSCLGHSQAGRPGPSVAHREAVSQAQKARYRANPEVNLFYGRTPSNFKGWGKGGYVVELGFSVRSTWERDYLLGLKRAGVPFIYEPKRYSLGPRRGTYLPDIQLTSTTFVEITGWDKPGKAEKRRMFVEKYGVTLHVVTERPTPASIQALIDFAKEVVSPNDELYASA